MAPKECFSKLEEHVKTLQLPLAFKRDVLSSLVYFQVQAELTIEERAHPKELRKVWANLSQRSHGMKLFEKFQSEDLIWRTILCFVHAEEPTSLLVPKVERTKPVSPYAKWEAKDFFYHLSKLADDRTHLTAIENVSLNVGLWYLEGEAIKARGSRNPKRIKETWLSIHPLLEKLGLLKEFQHDERIKNQLNFFVNDKMG